MTKDAERISERLRNAQMARAAELYYRQELSQQQIAKVLGCSHSTVSRLLAEARETGVVEIHIRRHVETVPGLASQLRSLFNLREAIVVPNAGTDAANLRAVGSAAADLLLSIMNNGRSIGVTWGNTLAHMVDALEQVPLEGVEVIQMSGALGEGDPDVDGPKLAIKLAEYFGGTCKLVPAPAIVESAEARETLMRQPAVRRALARAAEADIMVQGIGTLAETMSSLERAGYIGAADRKAAHAQGAVGHIVARMIDADGNEVGDLAERVVSVPLDSMRQAKWSIGVSAAAAKVPAILGALRGGYFNTIVVDEESAQAMLRLRNVAAA